MGNFINDDGTIPSGLPIDIMRHCMENRELLTPTPLSPLGSTLIYIGTGDQDLNGCAKTSSTLLSDGYFTSLKGSNNVSEVIDRGGVSDKNFKRYNYLSILTFINPDAVYAGEIHYSSNNIYCNIEFVLDPSSPTGKTYTMRINSYITNDSTLLDEAESYTLYSFLSISTPTIYYTDIYGANSNTYNDGTAIYTELNNQITNNPYNSPNLYAKVLADDVYEFTVNNATTVAETEQFSTLKGMKGIIAQNSMVTKYIDWNENTTFLMYAGLLRFSYLRFMQIVPTHDIEFVSSKTYFVFNYRGGNNKILYTQEQFNDALNSAETVYEMPKYDNNNLYFVNSNGVDESDYRFLDVYSDYDFVQNIKNIFGTIFLQANIGYFSSDFLDCNYISLGYTTALSRVRTLVQLDSVEGTEEESTSLFLKGYQRRYIVEGTSEYITGSSLHYNRFYFRKLWKLEESGYPAETHAGRSKDLLASSESNAHYMIVYKVIEQNPS